MTTELIIVPPRIAECCGPEHSRYALATVQRVVDEERSFFVATDGRLAVYVEGAGGVPGIQLIEARKGSPEIIEDEQFPPCEEPAVLRDADKYLEDGGYCYSMDASLLIKLARAICKPGSATLKIELIFPKDRTKPVLCVGREGAIGVLMPTVKRDDPIGEYQRTRERFLETLQKAKEGKV